MRRTPLGSLILAAGWFCFPLALVVGTLAPAILGVLLVALVTAQRPAPPVVTVRREAPSQAKQGEPMVVVTEATGPDGAPLDIVDAPPPQLRVTSTKRHDERGRVQLVQHLVPEAPGVMTWGTVRVRVKDAWGVMEDEVSVPLPHHLRVLPDESGMQTGRRVGRRGVATGSAKHRLATDWEPEIERLRDYQGGDRFRDIDWAHSTQVGKLIVREMSRHQQLSVVVLLQASQSMRWKRRASKLETGIQASLAILSAAQAAGLPVGLVAFDDRGVAAQVKAIASRKAVQASLERLAALPGPVVGEAAPPRVRPAEETVAASPRQRAFLEAVSAFDARGSRGLTPIESALGAIARVSPQPALVVCLLDVEENPAIANAVTGRLRRHGHRPVVVGLATAAHHYALREVDDAVLDRILTWRTNRATAQGTCDRQRVPFLMMGPRVTPEAVRGVVQSARA